MEIKYLLIRVARSRRIKQRRNAQEGDQRTSLTEPRLFANRAMSTGRIRHSERVAPGLGPTGTSSRAAGGLRER